MDVFPLLLTSLASQLEDYLLHPELLRLHDTAPAQRFQIRCIKIQISCPPREPHSLSLLASRPAPRDLVLKVVRDPTTWEVQDFVERRVKGQFILHCC